MPLKRNANNAYNNISEINDTVRKEKPGVNPPGQVSIIIIFLPTFLPTDDLQVQQSP